MNNKSNKTVCVFHSVDLYGWMSAAIVKHWWFSQSEITPTKYELENQCAYLRISKSESIDFIGYNYGQSIPDLSEYDKVIMCDVSFPKETMLELNLRLGINFVWIDHHQRTIDEVDDHIIEHGIPMEGLVTENGELKAACELTWQYFFPNEPMPEIVRLLGRYDCFGHKTKSFEMTSDGYIKAKEYLKEVGKLKEFENNKTYTDGYSLVYYANDVAKRLSEELKVLEFQYGARQVISNYEEAYKWLLAKEEDFMGYDIIDIVLDKGKSIYKYLCTEAKQAYKNGFEIKLFTYTDEDHMNPHKFICINKERFNPINFGIDYHADGYDGAACFHRTADGKWAFSLYNDNGKVDCSQIAKQFGGGGHKGASGFVTTDINSILK